MQSYLKYKDYYDRKAKAAPLEQGDFCFILQPLADHQCSKIPFREFRWIGQYVIEKVLPNENYIVRKLNSNKTQILHRIRLRKYTPNTTLQDTRPEGNLQADDEIIIPQDDLYIISWESNFDDFPPSTEQQIIPNDSPTHFDEQDGIITDLDLRSTRRQENTDAADSDSHSREVAEADLRSGDGKQILSLIILISMRATYLMKTVSPADGNKVLNWETIICPIGTLPGMKILIFQISEGTIQPCPMY